MSQILTGVNGGTFPNQCVAPSPTEFVTAASVAVGEQALLNECKYLYDTKAGLETDNTFTGVTTFEGDVGFLGAVTVNSATLLAGSGSRLQVGVNARLSLSGIQRLTDADHTVFCAPGLVVILAQPTAVRTLTIAQASDTNAGSGDLIEFWMPVPGATNADYYEIKREGGGGSYIARLIGQYDSAQASAFARVHFEGGVWRLTGGAGITVGAHA